MSTTLAGNVEIILSKLTAHFHEKRGAYAIRAFKNRLEDSSSLYAECRRLQSRNQTVEWVNPGSPITLSLQPGTYALRLVIYRCDNMQDKGAVFGNAEVDMVDLIPGSVAVVSIQSASLSSTRLPPLGSVELATTHLSLRPHAPVSIAQQETDRAPILNTLHKLAEDLLMTHEVLVDHAAMAFASQLTEVLTTYLLTQLKSPSKSVSFKPAFDVPSPVHDILSLIHAGFRYIVTNKGKIRTERITKLVSELCYASARCLFVVFGMIHAYGIVTYKMIKEWHYAMFDELVKQHYSLVMLRARLTDACEANIAAPLLKATSKDAFIQVLAAESVQYFVGAGDGQFRGPYMDIVMCLRYKLIVQLLDEWKKYTSNADSAQERSAARCLMTYLAQHTHMLPSELQIPAERFEFTRTTSVTGMMQNATLQDTGGYGDITSAKMWDFKTKGKILVAVKSIKGHFTEEEQIKLYREIIASWTLNHPRLLPVAGITHLNGGRLSIVTCWMQNGHILKYAKKKYDPKHLDAAFTSWVEIKLKQIVEALRYLHGEHVIHGDIRGMNILLDDAEDVVITDFGLSVYADSHSKALWSTRTGNPRWMAPEISVAQADEGLSVRPTYASDIYSFAMVCFELFTLDVPWGEKTSELKRQELVAAGHRPPRPDSLTNDGLWKIIKRCCSFSPEQRGDAERLLHDMKRAVKSD